MNDNMAPSEDLESACPSLFAMNDYCRLCANKGDNMVPIYADEGADHRLETKIKIHLPFLNICIDDVLPKRICYNCASALLVWDELFDYSSVADEKLRSWFQSTSYDQGECKTVSFEDIGEFSSITEYEDISEVNIFNKNEKSDKTLNEMGKVSSISKSVNVLSHGLKPSVIQEDKKLNSNLKRYIDMTESDESLKICTSKKDSLSKNYSCSICAETFLKIRDKVKHECDIHDIPSIMLPIKIYTTTNRCLDDKEKDIVQNCQLSSDLNEKNDSNLLCVVCNISFKNLFDKLEHYKEHHNLQLATQHSPNVIESENDGAFFDESNVDPITQNNISNINIEQFNNSYVIPETSKIDSELIPKEEIKDEYAQSDDTENEFKCNYCDKQFSSKNVASKHVCPHGPDIQKSNSKSDIYDQYKVMIDNRLYYKCDQCPYAVEGRRYKLIYHMRVHTGEKPYSCEICSKQFRTAAFLRRHVVCFHEKVRGYQCEICGRSFSEKRNVDDHRRIHTGERPFVCETCGKSFAQRSSMKIHWKQMHESIKSHKCQYCDKSFIRKCHLVAHLTQHTGVRKYICSVCGKGFLRSGTLKGHTAVHSLERPFQCTICGDTFKLKKHLKQHGRVHGDPYTFGNTSMSQME